MTYSIERAYVAADLYLRGLKTASGMAYRDAIKTCETQIDRIHCRKAFQTTINQELVL